MFRISGLDGNLLQLLVPQLLIINLHMLYENPSLHTMLNEVEQRGKTVVFKPI